MDSDELEDEGPLDADLDEFGVPPGFPGQVNTLLRNNGNGTFSDLTDEAGLLVDLSQSSAVLFGDWDDDNDHIPCHSYNHDGSPANRSGASGYDHHHDDAS